MQALIAISCGALGFFGLPGVLFLLMELHTAIRLRGKSTSEIEEMAFGLEERYFSFIGQDHRDVVEYRTLVEARDVAALRKNWGRLSKSFRRLEREAGHSGRPLILDYYCDQGLVFRELARRSGINRGTVV